MANIERGSDGLLHQFTPIVCVRMRKDGRYDVEIDWGDAFLDTYEASDLDPIDQDDPRVLAACAAVDQWAGRNPQAFIIHPAPQGD